MTDTWHLYRDGRPYSLIVHDRGGPCKVDIHDGHDGPHLGTVWLDRNTHLVGDMMPHVDIALAMAHNGRERNDEGPTDDRE